MRSHVRLRRLPAGYPPLQPFHFPVEGLAHLASTQGFDQFWYKRGFLPGGRLENQAGRHMSGTVLIFQ